MVGLLGYEKGKEGHPKSRGLRGMRIIWKKTSLLGVASYKVLPGQSLTTMSCNGELTTCEALLVFGGYFQSAFSLRVL